MIEVLGGWPGNTLENEYTATVTPLLSSQSEIFLCGKCSQPFPSARYVRNKWLMDSGSGS